MVPKGFRKVSDIDIKISRSWAAYRWRCKIKNRELSITKSQFSKLVKEPCHYCGSVIDNDILGIDRKNSNKGYILGNCVPSCAQCNLAKRGTSYKDFFKWIKRVYEKHKLYR